MSTQIVVLEELTLVSPFGVRFWDVTVAAPAQPGLTVTAFPDAIPELISNAIVGRSGIYSFTGLRGLRRFENGAGDDAFWSANPPTIPYTVEIDDPENRYLPFHFSTMLPVRGIFGLYTSPVSTTLTPDATWLPVFSTPSRSVSGPSAIVRAWLQDDLLKVPAAWAMVTAQFQGMPAIAGIADGRGMISLIASYPEPKNFSLTSPLTSPLGGGAAKLTDQSWPIDISVFYTPGQDPNSSPDLQALLQQNAATAWRDTNHSAPAGGFAVGYGKDLVLRSLDSGSARELPVLLITPAGSPL